MKRTVCICLTALMLMGALSGCQKTPESPIVVGKNNKVMLEKAKVDDPQPESDDTSIDLYERLGAPQTYTSDLTSKGGKLTVHTDANVILPEHEIPISRVQPVTFSTEQVKMMAAALFGINTKYVEGVDKKTKGVYEWEIQRLRDGIADWEHVGTYLFDMVYNTKEEAEQALNKALQEASSAPESLPEISPDFSWKKPYVWSDAEGEIETTDTYMTLWTMPDDSTYSWMDVSNSRETTGNAKLQYNRDFLRVPGGEIPLRSSDVSTMLHTSQSDAYTLAAAMVRNIGLTDFVCTAQYGVMECSDPAGYCKYPFYAFMFTRQYAGVAETYTNECEAYNVGYNTNWPYEQVQVLVDDSGIAIVNYANPCQVVETVMATTTLMPFSDIKDIFERMVVIVGNRVDMGAASALEKQEYVITTVRLGLMSVREQNTESGLVIPVWDFLGYENSTSNGETSANRTNELHSYLTINAVDGSIIERGNGY